MTNSIALFLVVAIIAFFALDHYVLHLDAPTFLLRRLVGFIEMLAFWR